MDLQIHNFPSQLDPDQQFWQQLIQQITQTLQMKVNNLNIIFVDDPTLQQMHLQYLNDPEKTDVMTFDLSDGDDLEGEIYISIDRARDQAKQYQVSLAEEILRLIIHGLLHLKGYNDLLPEEQKIMKQQEDELVERFRKKLPN